MADELRLTITLPTTVSGALVPVLQTTGSYYLRADPFSSNTYTGSHIANGSWSFGTVQDGVYELWNATDKIASFGRKYISDNEPDLTNVYVKAGGKVYADEYAERTSGNGMLLDGTKIKDGVIYADNMAEKNTNAGVTIETVLLKDGKGTFTGLDTNVNTSGSGATNRPKMVYSDGYSAPVNDEEFAEKKYVDDKFATATVTPYQESAQHRRIITDGVTETGKVYKTFASAVASLSPTSTALCDIEMVSHNLATMSVAHANLTNYINFYGKRHHNIILGGSGASVTVNMVIKGMTLWLSNEDIVGARTYNGITFEDCVIYSYQNLTFTNCKMRNCMVYQGSGKSCTFTGSSEILNSAFTQAITVSAITGLIANTTSETLTSYSMPADPLAS